MSRLLPGEPAGGWTRPRRSGEFYLSPPPRGGGSEAQKRFVCLKSTSNFGSFVRSKTFLMGMAERAHGRQRQQRGWPGQPAPTLPGARATPAQPASGGGCLPQPRWAVCATGAGAHQGQTSREGEKDIWWTAGTACGGTGHLGLTHTETQRGRLWTACGQRCVDSKNS